MAVKMRLIGGEWGAKMAPENGGKGTTLARSIAPTVLPPPQDKQQEVVRIPSVLQQPR